MREESNLKNTISGEVLTGNLKLQGVTVSVKNSYRETKTDEKGKGFSAKLWSIDLTGYNERLVKTPTDGSDPSWSSLLSN